MFAASKGKLIAIRNEGQQLIYLTRFSAAFDLKYVENTTYKKF